MMQLRHVVQLMLSYMMAQWTRLLISLNITSEKIEHMESEIEAYEMSGKNVEAEFAALEKEGKIDEELESLKARLDKRSADNKSTENK